MSGLLTQWTQGAQKRRVSAYAVPGVGECLICMEVVPYVKVLDCEHCLCLPCTQNMLKAASSSEIECPHCRQMTNVSHGMDDLPTKYFGKIKCDLCLEKKTTDDMWWCAACVRALCSKCNIKEHAQKQHRISEWNKMEQVQFSVDYIDSMEVQRQHSSETELNRKLIREYLHQVEQELLTRISGRTDLTTIRNNLISRYGSRFSSSHDLLESPASASVPSHHSDEAPKTIARVLQLAGQEISDTAIPNFFEQSFQVYFSLPPGHVAKYIRQHMELIPLEKDTPAEQPAPNHNQSAAQGSNDPQMSDPRPSPSAPPLPPRMDKPNENRDRDQTPETDMKPSAALSAPDSTQMLSRHSPGLPVLSVDFSPSLRKIVLHLPAAVEIYDTNNQSVITIPISKQSHSIRSASLWHRNGNDTQLVLALQSTAKSYEWIMEVFDISQSPSTQLFRAHLDIDPEDHVDSLRLFAQGKDIYEMRLCAQNVSEIYLAQVEKKKKDKVKLKETLVYAKAESRITRLRCVQQPNSRERFLILWDDLSSCLYRLLINKDGRCELQSTILHSVEPVPFTLTRTNCLLLFDPHLHQICASDKPIGSRLGVSLKKLVAHDDTVRCIRVINDGKVIVVTLTGDLIQILTFQFDLLVLKGLFD